MICPNYYNEIESVTIGQSTIKKGLYFSNNSYYQFILSAFINNYPFIRDGKRWLITIDKETIADCYIDRELPLILRTQTKGRKYQIGDTIQFNKEVRTFHSIRLDKTKELLSNENAFIGYISGSTFGIDIDTLFFDLTYSNALENIQNFFSEITEKVQSSTFKTAYEVCEIYTEYSELQKKEYRTEQDTHILSYLMGRLDRLRGWFPFQRILGKEFENLYNHISKSSNENLYLPYLPIINAFDNHRINEMISGWKQTEVLPYKELEIGLKHYQNQDPFSSIHVLIPYIEGIVRHTLDSKSKSMKQLAISEKISKDLERKLHATDDNSLYITGFKSYLENTWFSPFSNNETLYTMSRNTVSHGIGQYEEYTLEKALQLILTIDQLYYIYWYDEKPNDFFYKCECGYIYLAPSSCSEKHTDDPVSCPKCGKQEVIQNEMQ